MGGIGGKQPIVSVCKSAGRVKNVRYRKGVEMVIGPLGFAFVGCRKGGWVSFRFFYPRNNISIQCPLT